MLQPGDHIGRYEIQRRLGRGGMGTVYVGHDPVLGRLVAIKLFAGDLDAADAEAKFAREARAAAALNHSNIVTIYDFGEFESQPFIVMEYIQGETVARLIRRKTELPLSDRLRILEELCAGVAYAHGFEVIHRDIKPANLMLDRANRLKILDFGIARILGTSMSKATAMIGTPGYMAPEQIRGGVTDRRSDLFSIGVVAYELLSYSEAFPGESVPAITHRILADEPVPLSELVIDIPSELVTVIERALRKDPAERFPDAASLGTAISALRREVDGDPRYRTLVPTQPYPDVAGERGTGREPDSKRQPSGTGRTTPVDPAGRREDLVRRRTEKIAVALARAGALLEEGRLSEAHDACLEALTLDETHSGALQLEFDISAAVIRQRVQELTARGREALARGALTESEDALRQLRKVDPRAPEARLLERELRASRNQQAVAAEIAESLRLAVERARVALDRGDADTAWTAARQALFLAPDSAEAKLLEAEAQRRMDAEVGAETVVATSGSSAFASGSGHDADALAPTMIAPTVIAPGTQSPPKPPADVSVVPQKTSAATRVIPSRLMVTLPRWREAAWRSFDGLVARLRQLRAAKAPADREGHPKLRSVDRVVIAWTGAMILVLAITVSAFVFMQPSSAAAPPPNGTLRVDARPWATVVAVVGPDGTRQPLPDDASTPLSIRLPKGVYRITLAGPSPDSTTRELTATIVEAKETAVDGGRFATVTADAYFEPYLSATSNQPQPVAATVESAIAAAPGGSR
jgi:tetratricopeptide (TPR) repeat protein